MARRHRAINFARPAAHAGSLKIGRCLDRRYSGESASVPWSEKKLGYQPENRPVLGPAASGESSPVPLAKKKLGWRSGHRPVLRPEASDEISSRLGFRAGRKKKKKKSKQQDRSPRPLAHTLYSIQMGIQDIHTYVYIHTHHVQHSINQRKHKETQIQTTASNQRQHDFGNNAFDHSATTNMLSRSRLFWALCGKIPR
jgi:hypothetical protein